MWNLARREWGGERPEPGAQGNIGRGPFSNLGDIRIIMIMIKMMMMMMIMLMMMMTGMIFASFCYYPIG